MEAIFHVKEVLPDDQRRQRVRDREKDHFPVFRHRPFLTQRRQLSSFPFSFRLESHGFSYQSVLLVECELHASRVHIFHQCTFLFPSEGGTSDRFQALGEARPRRRH